MEIVRRGSGTPEYAVVACVHGDEVCGKRAIERFLESDPTFREPVKFVVANEEALAKGVRFVEEDLNRSFPGEPDGGIHEQRLAARLADELADCRFVDLHATRSFSEPFALVGRVDDTTKHLARATGLPRVVDIGYVSRGMIGYVDGVAVECGLLGTDEAAANGHDAISNFLAAVGAVEGDYDYPDPTLYSVFNEVAGSGYEFVGENFELVEKGEVFARKGESGMVADRDFYPVLMSTHGYDETVGFQADRLGRLSEYEVHRPRM
jgi:predicted deacylase